MTICDIDLAPFQLKGQGYLGPCTHPLGAHPTMVLATVLITLPVMGLLIGFDFWHCRARNGDSVDVVTDRSEARGGRIPV